VSENRPERAVFGFASMVRLDFRRCFGYGLVFAAL
jgi:hypothetical protein